ncbi:MAG: THUMP domain-containing protein [Candidatus Thermoplasmatota archaeon]
MTKSEKLFFELSQEHKQFPTTEIKSVLKAEKIVFETVESNKDVLVIDIIDAPNGFISRLQERLAMTFYINRFLFSCKSDIRILEKKAKKKPVTREGSIAVKYRNRSRNIDSRDIVKCLASKYTNKRKVDLDNPDVEIRVLITDDQLYAGVKEAKVDRKIFEKRKVQHRPFFSPISLHPIIARVLVNLSGVRKDEFLLDPFCGTGGILIEAGLIGVNVVGSDVERKMVEGCRDTLDFYGIENYKVFHADIGDIKNFVDDVDAVVTDFPYGKATTTVGEPLERLYRRSFDSIEEALKRDGRAVVGCANEEMLKIGKKFLDLEKIFRYRVHSSLTRYFGVFNKKC